MLPTGSDSTSEEEEKMAKDDSEKTAKDDSEKTALEREANG